jgi:hemoglobin
MTTDIASRADIDALLLAFYGRALHDEQLGPVFAAAEMDLATHLPRIGDFWEVSLLGTGDYSGRPMQLHAHLAEACGLVPELFDRWLELWHETLAGLFAGPVTDRAGTDAIRMAGGMRRAIFSSS